MRGSFVAMLAVFTVICTPALAAGAYHMDAKGKCHDEKGKFAKQSMCAPPAHCRDIKTKKFARCGLPGTESVPSH